MSYIECVRTALSFLWEVNVTWKTKSVKRTRSGNYPAQCLINALWISHEYDVLTAAIFIVEIGASVSSTDCSHL